MFSRPSRSQPRARIGCTISLRVNLNIRAVCGRPLRSFSSQISCMRGSIEIALRRRLGGRRMLKTMTMIMTTAAEVGDHDGGLHRISLIRSANIALKGTWRLLLLQLLATPFQTRSPVKVNWSAGRNRVANDQLSCAFKTTEIYSWDTKHVPTLCPDYVRPPCHVSCA